MIAHRYLIGLATAALTACSPSMEVPETSRTLLDPVGREPAERPGRLGAIPG